MATMPDGASAKDASPGHADELVPSEPDTLLDLDPRDVPKALACAEELKQEGNDHFRAKRWDEAIAIYRSALGHLPRSPQPANSTTEGDCDDDDNDPSQIDHNSSNKGTTQEGLQAQRPPASELEIGCAKARAILNANISACYAKLGEHKEVVSACTEALKDDPTYIKALQRRATANEQINSWSALSSAQEDYKKLLELLPPTSPDVVSVRRTLATLPPRVESAQKRETAEMLDKLKGLGNSLLGNFGLSTDNFQFMPNGQGGYSMNFVQNPT
ncbi:TPR-like protein [Ganoderma leucocontextum]|nr:TPR-like protein [Ganoderma leucocontextum]